MQKLLIIIACCSLLWNYSIPERYKRYEAGELLCGRRRLRLILFGLSQKIGVGVAKTITLLLLFLAWIFLSWYFVVVIVSFSAVGLKVVTAVSAVLATISLCQQMSAIYSNYIEWCYSQEDNIISISKGCWEIILAGLIIVKIILYN